MDLKVAEVLTASESADLLWWLVGGLAVTVLIVLLIAAPTLRRMWSKRR